MQKFRRRLGILAVGFILALTNPGVAYGQTPADVSFAQMVSEAGVPIYEWSSSTLPPRAIIVAIHGVTLHGRRYDRLARELAPGGVMTLALDMRGFGVCRARGECAGDTYHINYRDSQQDLTNLLVCLRAQYPGVPICCLGESLGANLAIALAGTHPELIDGLILSSPCVARYWHVSPRLVLDTFKYGARPTAQISMKPYVQQFLSPNPNVVSGYEDNPLIRKTLNLCELLKSVGTNRNSLKKAGAIPPTMPVLTIAGPKDNLYKPKSVEPMLAKIPSNDNSIYWPPGRGHLLLETSEVEPDIVSTLASWVAEHVDKRRGLAAVVTTTSE